MRAQPSTDTSFKSSTPRRDRGTRASPPFTERAEQRLVLCLSLRGRNAPVSAQCASRSLRTGAHRGGVSRQFEALPRVGQLVAVDLQDRHVLIHEIADIDVIALRTE